MFLIQNSTTLLRMIINSHKINWHNTRKVANVIKRYLRIKVVTKSIYYQTAINKQFSL